LLELEEDEPLFDGLLDELELPDFLFKASFDEAEGCCCLFDVLLVF